MEGNLVIVESPAKAKTIQRFLGESYIVRPSFGHIRDLSDKDLGIDIAHDFAPQYVIPADKKKVVSELKKLAGQAQTVWLASDEDREGEAISWHLKETLGLDPARTRRIAFHEITKPAIENAVAHPRDIDMNLVNAQQARRVLDRLVGFELSPVLWRKVGPKLSAGRVQSVALRLICDREKEIMAFEGKPFYRVEGTFHPEGKAASVKLKAVLDTRFDSIGDARRFLEDSIGATYKVSGMEDKEGKRTPAAPFTTSTLQQEASRVLRMPVGVTMRVAQSLYERGLITYMRTDSTNLSSLAVNSAKQYIASHFGAQYSRPRQYKTTSKGAQEAHEAIRPTFIDHVEIEGTAQEQKLYKLIWRRTLASQMADASLLTSTVSVASDRRSEKFVAQAAKVLFDGFLKLYMESRDDDEDERQEAVLPELSIGDALTATSVTAECKFSAAPPRYTEATLVKTLEKLGIGRPSTYAPTISTLTTGRGYVVKGDKQGRKIPVENLTLRGGTISSSRKEETVGAEKGRLLPQEIGMLVSDYLTANFPDIMNYDFTANVEQEFDSIAAGDMRWNEVIRDFYTPFHRKVEDAIQSKEYARVERVIGVAPDGETVTGKFGHYGPYVQKGPAEKRQFASLDKGQLIENITLEEALKLFEFPRKLGSIDGKDVTVLKGRFGPYIKFGDENISIPRGTDPGRVSLDDCASIIRENKDKGARVSVIAQWPDSDITIVNGLYGPYIKHAGANYKIPKGQDASALDESACKALIDSSQPTGRGRRRTANSKKTTK